jgi:hypothetical protein
MRKSDKPIDRMKPTVIYQVADLRVVLRALDRYPEGYVDIERKYKDSMDTPGWRHVESFDLRVAKCNSNETMRELLIYRLLDCDSRLPHLLKTT